MGNHEGTKGTKEKEMEFDDLSHQVIGCALEVHRTLGPGLLESAYEQCLAHELSLNNIGFKLQEPLPVVYKGKRLDCGYRADVLVADQLLVELKSVERLIALHEAQIITYLKVSRIKVGLLMNFNAEVLKDGLKRFVV